MSVDTNSKPTTVWGLLGIWQMSPTYRVIIPIPISRVDQPTVGLGTALSRSPTEPLFICQNPQCPRGEDCPDLHVSIEYVQQMLNVPRDPCCAFCDCVFSRTLLHDVPALQLQLGPFHIGGGPIAGGGHSPLPALSCPIERLSFTTAIARNQSWGEVKVSPSGNAGAVCPDHIRGMCPRGKDCPLFHICRQRYKAIQAMAGMHPQH